MKKFIGYFDYLGFSDFIKFNDHTYQSRIMNNIFRDIENALGQGKYKKGKYGSVADISDSTLQCLNFSDTVIFWTKDSSIESFEELLKVSYTFNWQAISHFFPVRGSIVYGEFTHVDFRQPNEKGGLYNLNSAFGTGLVTAYEKAESQNWAGTVIDISVINELYKRNYNIKDLDKYALKYKVPYKKQIKNQNEEFVYRILKGELNEESRTNIHDNLVRNFSNHKKRIDDPRTIQKLENTFTFILNSNGITESGNRWLILYHKLYSFIVKTIKKLKSCLE